jgi:hypothetical protein
VTIQALGLNKAFKLFSYKARLFRQLPRRLYSHRHAKEHEAKRKHTQAWAPILNFVHACVPLRKLKEPLGKNKKPKVKVAPKEQSLLLSCRVVDS